MVGHTQPYPADFSFFIVLKSCLNNKWDKSMCNLLLAYLCTMLSSFISSCIRVEVYARLVLTTDYWLPHPQRERHWALEECNRFYAAFVSSLAYSIHPIKCISLRRSAFLLSSSGIQQHTVDHFICLTMIIIMRNDVRCASTFIRCVRMTWTHH